MATETAAPERVEKKQDFLILDKYFRIPPVKAKARDGSGRIMIVEHRIGKDAKAYGREELLTRTGLHKEMLDDVSAIQRKVHDRALVKKYEREKDRTIKGTLTRWMTQYRKFLAQFYAAQQLLVRMRFVNGGNGDVLYIQALVDKNTKQIVVGDPLDLSMWSESQVRRTRGMHEEYREAVEQAQVLLRLPDLNRDLKERLKLIASGNIPASFLLPAPGK